MKKVRPNPRRGANLFWYYWHVFVSAIFLGMALLTLALGVGMLFYAPDRSWWLFLVAGLCGAGGAILEGLPALFEPETIQLDREDEVITSNVFRDLQIGSSPAVFVMEKLQQTDEKGAPTSGFRVVWMPDLKEKEKEIDAQTMSSLAEEHGKELVEFCRDYQRVRSFCETLCKLGKADLFTHWQRQGRLVHRPYGELDQPLGQRLQREDLPPRPELDSENVQVKEEGAGKEYVEWIPGFNQHAFQAGIGFLIFSVLVGLLIASPVELSGSTGPFRFFLPVSMAVIGGGLITGAYLYKKLRKVRIQVSPEEIRLSYRKYGLIPEEKRISTDRIEELLVSTGANHGYPRLKIVGDQLYKPFGPNLTRYKASNLRALFLHILVQPE